MSDEQKDLRQRLTDLKQALTVDLANQTSDGGEGAAPPVETIDFDKLCECLDECLHLVAEAQRDRFDIEAARQWFSHRITAFRKARGLLTQNYRLSPPPPSDESLPVLMREFQQEMELLREHANGARSETGRMTEQRLKELIAYRS